MAKLAPAIRHLIITLITLAGLSATPMSNGLSGFALGEAQAQSRPMVELVSGGDAIGDGVTPVTLHLVTYNPAGTPMSGASFKLKAQAGTVSKVAMVRAGLYAVDWTPPKVEAVSDVQLQVTGKSPDGTKIDKTWTVSIRPTLSQQVTITANPAELTLGQDGGSTLNIVLSGGPHQFLEGVELDVRASSGTVENVTHLGDGKFAASYRPPAKFFPHLAILTVADKRDPNRTYGAIAIPLIGKANFPIVGQPNSNVMVTIDNREFGPVQADATGRAQVPLEVRPGFMDARVVSVIDGRKTEEPLDLQVPTANRVSLFPTSPAIPADPTVVVPIRAYVTNAQGGPDETARVNFSTTAGGMSEAVHEGNGVYKADFTPPFGNKSAQATITVQVDDLKGAQVASANMNLLAARPGSIQLTPEPASLSAAARGFKVHAKVQSADGVGMPGREVLFLSNGAKQGGTVQDLGSGDYHAKFSTTGKGAVEIIATARGEGSNNPLRHVLMFPSRDRLPADGLSSTMLTVLTLDEYGYPVSNIPVNLSVVTGDGSVPATTTTDAAGMAQIHFTAGRQNGVTRLAAEARGHTSMIPLLMAPPAVAQGYALPASGSQFTMDMYNAWRRIIQPARLEREGMTGAPIENYSSGAKVGPVTTVTAIAEPNQVAAGGTVVLRMMATDAEGRGVGGQQLQVVASPGEITAVTDQGGGKYTTQLTVPQGVAGKAKISVMAPAVGVATMLDVPITGGSWKTVGVADQGTDKGESAPEPKQKRKDGEFPWMRANLGLAIGGYHYKQEATVAKGPLYDYDITFGGAATPPATAPGLDLGVRAWIPGVEDYFGVNAKFRTVLYAVSLPEFNTPISDWLTHMNLLAVGRLPIEIDKKTKAHVGARLGFGVDDFMIYRQSGNVDLRVLDYGPLVVPGLIIGPEVGVDWNGTVFGQAGMNFGFANASAYYSLAFDAQLGYAFHPDWFAYAGTDINRRSMAVYMVPEGATETEQVGILEDHVNLFTIGIGMQM